MLNFAIFFCLLHSECHRGCGLGKRSSKRKEEKQNKPNQTHTHTRPPTTALPTCARAFAYCSLLRACQITVWARFLGPARRVMPPYVTVVCSQILCIRPTGSSPFRSQATPTNWGVLSRFRGKVAASSASKLERSERLDFSAPNFKRDVYYTREAEKVACERERARLIAARVIPPLPPSRRLSGREANISFSSWITNTSSLLVASSSSSPLPSIFSPAYLPSPSPISTGSGFRRGKMYDCMEAFAVTPRQLYDVTNRSACMLRKSSISPFALGLDPFGWPQPASLQCRWIVADRH